MTTTITKQPRPRRRTCNLLLHMGSHSADRNDVVDTPTPEATATWQPTPHVEVLNQIERNLSQRGLNIINEAHGLSHDNARYFGLLEVEPENAEAEMRRVVGVRNAHDKRFAAGIVAGAQVLVCDNLCFSGDIALARKHTSNILKDLPTLAAEAVDRLSGYWGTHARRVSAYKDTELDDLKAHDLIIRSVDAGVMANSYIPKVLDQWRDPEHTVFKRRTYWSLQNAYTNVFRGRVDLLPERTTQLHQLLDAEVGLEAGI